MNKQIPFFKYQGAGNDFILIDQRDQKYLTRVDQEQIEKLCNRRFGIGADGLILLELHEAYDFEMVYFNSDGRESSMCGNGGRCIVAFAVQLGLIEKQCRFLAIDGPHEGILTRPDWVELKMQDVQTVEQGQGYYYLNTGSPHYVQFTETLEEVDVVGQGRAIRYSDPYKAEGTNVNFVEVLKDGLAVATYERGVEDETLACGTGVTACALAYTFHQPELECNSIDIQAKGGKLTVRFEKNGAGFSDIWLCGPATLVFQGKVALES